MKKTLFIVFASLMFLSAFFAEWCGNPAIYDITLTERFKRR